jgi:hypothetical protein
MIKNLTKHDLRNLAGLYTVVEKHKYKQTVKKPIPFQTGVGVDKFPRYLKKYKRYYDKGNYSWLLKSEYVLNRPEYSITLELYYYDVELTPEGEKKVKEYFNKYQRLINEYKKFLKKA